MPTKPMEKVSLTPQKRNKNLVPLSREHHFGLLFCWKIREGLQNGTSLSVLQAYVTYFWQRILQPHCQEEEWLMERFLPGTDPLRLRIEEEHRMLQGMIELISGGVELAPYQFQTLQKELTDHIRWEERELFPYLQDNVSLADLALAGDLMEEHHKGSGATDTFTPEFWKKA